MPNKRKSSKKKGGDSSDSCDELDKSLSGLHPFIELANEMENPAKFDELESLSGPFIELAEKVNEMENRIITLELRGEQIQQHLLFRLKGFQ